MNYSIQSLTIKSLIEMIESEILDLSPSYQREFIWSLKDQKELIKTIQKVYPLPNLFINRLEDGKFEMVDGQQRSRSIYRHYKDEIKFTKKDNLETLDKSVFLNYELPVVFLSNASQEEIREFYVLINKKGKFLNVPEVQRSEFRDTNFLKLAEKITADQKFINLDIFSNTSSIRLNDRDFVQELLGYLLMGYKDFENKENIGYEGIRDKKKYIDSEIFPEDISEDESKKLENHFNRILDKIVLLDSLESINSTRYRQRNDFYTLFNFINKHTELSDDILKYQYKILLQLDGKDSKGNQFIRPTNDECESLKNYAINCVSQSNSKHARKIRLDFFESMLINRKEDVESNETMLDVLSYLVDQFGNEKVGIKKISDYYLLDVDLLNS
ncbi:DUF262 domain-containing protein [Winogradskyella vincentii]|uniref:DUF262 domain-containing protein n=1 Tax=Winogradskyella vincentii TaxID=2877122 RepID=A0ABS7XVP3_9FLAO|nr:DUF262 domain-containing protein [Winogradskyella vincentii]MCA0151718.1 DUF262 domain-containing protein [Winogradskyella vincentii]